MGKMTAPLSVMTQLMSPRSITTEFAETDAEHSYLSSTELPDSVGTQALSPCSVTTENAETDAGHSDLSCTDVAAEATLPCKRGGRMLVAPSHSRTARPFNTCNAMVPVEPCVEVSD